jgi:hypothetical protein
VITPILTLKIRNRRDVLRARQRARQIAGLLGFELLEKTAIACAVFEIARRACRSMGGSAIRFQLDESTLAVFPVKCGHGRADVDLHSSWDSKPFHPAEPATDSMLRLDRPQPSRALPLDRESLAFVAAELSRLTPFDVFEEIHQHNQELLDVCQQLAAAVSMAPIHDMGKPAA